MSMFWVGVFVGFVFTVTCIGILMIWRDHYDKDWNESD